MAILKAVGFLGILGLLSFAEAGWLPGSVGGGQVQQDWCAVDSTHQYFEDCTGPSPHCSFQLVHYDWSLFATEDAIVSQSMYCSAFSNGVGGVCGGSARNDTIHKNCAANW